MGANISLSLVNMIVFLVYCLLFFGLAFQGNIPEPGVIVLYGCFSAVNFGLFIYNVWFSFPRMNFYTY